MGPPRQELHQDPQNSERKNHQHNRSKRAFACGECHLISRAFEETLREQLAANHDVSAHGKNADQNQPSGESTNTFARDLGDF